MTEDVDSYSLSLDGETVLIKHDKDYTCSTPRPDAAKDEDDDQEEARPRRTCAMLVDPPAEWAEMFDNAWRLERDMFFSPVMNGVRTGRRCTTATRKLVPLLGSREDLNYLIGQMLGEIGNSHTYVGGGDDGDTGPTVHAALLGVDWALDPASGRYRIRHHLSGRQHPRRLSQPARPNPAWT